MQWCGGNNASKAAQGTIAREREDAGATESTSAPVRDLEQEKKTVGEEERSRPQRGAGAK